MVAKSRRMIVYVESSLFRGNEKHNSQFKDIFEIIKESQIIKTLNSN